MIIELVVKKSKIMIQLNKNQLKKNNNKYFFLRIRFWT